MTQSITNWYAAGAKLREIKEVCEAFQRGDQPEKTERLSTDQTIELAETVFAIVEFCVASLNRRNKDLEHVISIRDCETYRYARNYGRTMARLLLRHDEAPIKMKERMEEWLDREPGLPLIHIAY